MQTERKLPVVDRRKIRALRMDAGLSMRDLATRSEVSLSSVMRIEKEGGAVWPRTAKHLARGLGVKPADIYLKDES